MVLSATTTNGEPPLDRKPAVPLRNEPVENANPETGLGLRSNYALIRRNEAPDGRYSIGGFFFFPIESICFTVGEFNREEGNQAAPPHPFRDG